MATQLHNIEIEERIIAVLKQRKGAATAADVAADTGLPLDDVEIELKRLMTLYKSHLDVDDDGNLRYRFDPSLVRRGEAVERALYKVQKAVWAGFKWFFKAWIMLMLVGYTITFIVLLIALAVAGLAASSRSDSDSSDGLVRLPLYVLGRFLEYMFWFSLFDDSRSSSRSYGRARKKAEKPEKPFYQKVFDFVFGPDAVTDPLAAQQAFASFVRFNKGRLTPADWASRTGQSLEEAENALTAGIMRFGGEVDVTPDGNLVYRFDQLRVSAKTSGDYGRNIEPIWNKRAVPKPLTGNPGGTNGWIIAFNTFNLVMSLFVLGGVGAQVALPIGAIIGLGWVPLVFSVMFFAIPLLRWITNASAAKQAEQQNLRRQAYQAAYTAALEKRGTFIDPKVAKSVALALDGEPDLEGGGDVWVFETLAGQLEVGQAARAVEADRVVFGQTVFSSDEAEKSLEESELEEFDRRFAFELGTPAAEKVGAAQPARVLN
ncbi:MAG: hypothetical protein R3E66_12560 [bacterium]